MVTHCTTNMARVKRPSKTFRVSITAVDGSRNVLELNISIKKPVLNSKVKKLTGGFGAVELTMMNNGEDEKTHQYQRQQYQHKILQMDLCWITSKTTNRVWWLVLMTKRSLIKGTFPKPLGC